MTKVLNALLTVLGCWLVVSPLIFGYSLFPGIALTSGLGVITFIVALVATLQKEFKVGLDWLLFVLGIIVVIKGIAALVLSWGFGVNGIIIGILIAVIAFGATRFSYVYEGATFYDRGGTTMVDLKGLRVKDGDLLMKAMLLQSMPSTIYVRPDEIWRVVTMIQPEVIFALPKILVTGYKICKAQQKEAAATAAQEQAS